jgi:hypothetical protein
MGTLDNHFGPELAELSAQGWTNRDIIWPDLSDSKVGQITGERRFGDASTLIIPLDIRSVKVPSTPDSVVEFAQFSVSVNDVRSRNAPPDTPPAGRFLVVAAQLLASPALRYTYTTSFSAWHNYATDRLKRWAWLEWYKTRAEHRESIVGFPTTYPLVSELPTMSTMPQSWDYADDQIPVWYQEWKMSSSA